MKTTTSSSDTDHASSPSATSPDEARFKRANRRQVEMIMLSLNQRLDVDHPVRAVWAFVEGLDLTELYGKIKAVRKRPKNAMPGNAKNAFKVRWNRSRTFAIKPRNARREPVTRLAVRRRTQTLDA